MGRPVVLVAVLVLGVACSSRAPTAPSTAPKPTSSRVTIAGGLSGRDSCGSGGTVGGRQLTVRDGAGHVIGTTHTLEAGEEPVPGLEDVNGCDFLAPYSVTVPKVAFYQFSLEGTPLVVGGEPVSYEDLKSENFRHDMRIDQP